MAIDTSTAQMGLALTDGHQVLAEWIWLNHQHHTIQLAPTMLEMLKHTGTSMREVEALAVTTGPGSYTALRVGLALVKGLAVSRNLPIVGVHTLDVLAAGQTATALPLAALIQAGRGRVALGWYQAMPARSASRIKGRAATEDIWIAHGPAQVTTIDELARSISKPTLIAGELTIEERERLSRKKVSVILASPQQCIRRPSVLAMIGWKRYQAGQVDEATSLSPIYLQLQEKAIA